MSSASAAMLRMSLTLAFVSTVVAFETSEFKEADERGRRAGLEERRANKIEKLRSRHLYQLTGFPTHIDQDLSATGRIIYSPRG